MISSDSLAFAPVRKPLSCATDLVDVSHELCDVRTIADFLQFTRTSLRRIIPHSACGVAFGDLSPGARSQPSIFTVGFPSEIGPGGLASPTTFFRLFMEAWGDYGAPLMLSAEERTAPYALRRALTAFRLEDIAAAGIYGGRPAYCSFFTFHGLTAASYDEYPQTLRCIVPHLHCALAQLLLAPGSEKTGGLDQDGLTPRETEILDWVRQGKTNAEIAAILGISCGTVKVQVQHVLVKLRVNTRAQAVAKALSNGFLSLSPSRMR